jgi:hypothetical protein
MTAAHLTTYLPWLLSAITIVSTVLTGNKHRLAWLISLAGQAGWLAFIIASGSWGFLPLTATLTFLYLRNHMKWREEERLSAIEREHFGDPDKGTGIYAKASINWHADENPWKMAVTAAMICAHILRREHETDPEKALAELLAWEIDVALDPAVSSRAEALVQRGRDEPGKQGEFTEEEMQAEPRIYRSPGDYERRADGKVVRKDRWEWGVRNIASILVGARSEFEIDDIVAKVRELRSVRDAYEGAREDLLDWKRRAEEAEALLSFKPGLPETSDVDEAIRLSRMEVVQEAERDDYHLWALRILAAEIIGQRDAAEHVPPQPGHLLRENAA